MDSGNKAEFQPQFEIPNSPQEDGGESQHDQKHEQSAPQESKTGKAQPAASTAVQPLAPIQIVADDQAQALAALSQTPTSDEQLQEVHVSEKEWIDKAKKLVNENREDPFVQKKQVSDFKAQYIQKRFNKTLPKDDAVAA